MFMNNSCMFLGKKFQGHELKCVVVVDHVGGVFLNHMDVGMSIMTCKTTREAKGDVLHVVTLLVLFQLVNVWMGLM